MLQTITSFFHQYKQSDIDPFIRRRAGEQKLGEVVAIPAEESLPAFLDRTPASFIVIGIAEDIGVLANCGNGGTATAWRSFLLSFLNIQSNNFTRAETIAVIGHLSFDELKHRIEKQPISPEAKVKEYRDAVKIIDAAVEELVRLIVMHRKIPIVIGGGHNNCYPLIKGTATALVSTEPLYSQGINCVNLDAHMDYRAVEGRHSGNGFRYAKQEGFLKNYFVLSLHENYTSQHILNEVADIKDMAFITYEDIFIRQKKTWAEVLEEAGKFVTNDYFTGIELDLDSLSYFPSSAVTPCGVESREALQYIDYMARNCKVAYLHICEGIASNDGGLTGKLIGYLVSHFIKALSTK
ncbi:formimidoylglutamase [Chryseolinea sp. H1M3-3]|uniref:formimidoylglutamase n=1 Tax=Chryseolinea sp. H1M3-3 TaxID=3034144 RepID=UPI0023EB32DD|nr:formimidoylglutamase [Chryseolinea sp. H1M3-3]